MENYTDLSRQIQKVYSELSPVLQNVANFVLANPDEIALLTIKGISQQAGVHPSAVIRFSKELGFDGFKSMQDIFRNNLRANTPSYTERINVLKKEIKAGHITASEQACTVAIEQIESLSKNIDENDVKKAVDILMNAGHVFMYGRQRSEPIILLLFYGLAGLGIRTMPLKTDLATAKLSLNCSQPDDCLVIASFKNYSPQAIEIFNIAQERGLKIISITDLITSPIGKGADVIFTIKESFYNFPRTLSGAMTLVEIFLKNIAIQMTSDNDYLDN